MRIDVVFVLLSALCFFVNAHIFYFVPDNVTWPEAQTLCRHHYTDLATVEDQKDLDKLLESAPNDLRNEMWIGLHRKSATAPWIWSDQRSSAFRLWGNGQPNNYGGQQFCVGASPTLNWNDVECPLLRPSMCYSVTKRNTVRLKVKSSPSVNDPAVMTEILLEIKQILEEKGLPEDAKLSWKIQSDGNVFQQIRNKDVTTALPAKCEINLY